MRKQLKRFSGFLLIAAAALGLVLALVSLVAVWSYKNRVTALLDGQVGLAISVLDTTSQGLSVAETALQTTRSTVKTLHDTVQVLAESITDTLPLMDSLSGMLGQDLPQTIEATQTSLQAAQASAKVIDDVLKILTAIPFFRGKPYNPDVPLNMALADVSTSLDKMPAAFRAMESNIHKTSVNLSMVQDNVGQVTGEITLVQTSLEQASQIIVQYQDAAEELKRQLVTLQTKIPLAINLSAILLTLFLLWMAIAQIGLLTQGLELFKKE